MTVQARFEIRQDEDRVNQDECQVHTQANNDSVMIPCAFLSNSTCVPRSPTTPFHLDRCGRCSPFESLL